MKSNGNTAKNSAPWVWDVDLRKMREQFVLVETHDGTHREGRISGVQVRKVKINGTEFDVPWSITLNGDASDVIEFQSIKNMELT